MDEALPNLDPINQNEYCPATIGHLKQIRYICSWTEVYVRNLFGYSLVLVGCKHCVFVVNSKLVFAHSKPHMFMTIIDHVLAVIHIS